MMKVGNTEMKRRVALLLTTIVGALLLSSGVALAATMTCKAGVDCLGTKNADTLNGTDGKDNMFGRRGGDALKGLGEYDSLHGQRGMDRLLGGLGNDDLFGGAGDDTLNGGRGIDLYLFGNRWGKDSITKETAYGAEIYFSSDIEGEAPATSDVIVDLRSGAGPEAKDEGGTSTINWEGNVVNNVFGGNGDDEVIGNTSANKIYGYGGEDTIFGREGNDRINVVDASFGDTVHCGPGEDTVKYDADLVGVVSDSVDLDTCEHLDAS